MGFCVEPTSGQVIPLRGQILVSRTAADCFSNWCFVSRTPRGDVVRFGCHCEQAASYSKRSRKSNCTLKESWRSNRSEERSAGDLPNFQRIDVGIEHDQKFRVVQRLIGPRGKHMRDIVTMAGGAELWITGRGSRSWEDDEGPLRRVSGSGEMNEIGYFFSTQLSVPLSRTWRMSAQVSSFGRTLSVVFWKGLCFLRWHYWSLVFFLFG